MSRNSKPSEFIAQYDRRERRRALIILACVALLVVGLALAIIVTIFL